MSKMRVVGVGILAMQAACIVRSGGAVTSPAGTRAAPGAAASGNATVPNLFNLSREAAAEALADAGFVGGLREDTNVCPSTVEGTIIERGHVCRQRPFPGNVQSTRLPVTVQLQLEDPRRGGKGDFEWRLVPDLVGKSLDQARVAMREAGFTNEKKIVLFRIAELGCVPNVICRTSPSALQRAYLGSGMYVYTGRDPAAPKAAPTAAPPAPVEPQQVPPGEPTPPPPPKDAVPEPFF